MHISRKEFDILLETVEDLKEQQNELMDSIKRISEEFFREKDDCYDRLNDGIDNIKDLLTGEKSFNAQSSPRDFEQNIIKELYDIRRLLKSIQSAKCNTAYDVGAPVDEIICAIKDYYDSKECY